MAEFITKYTGFRAELAISETIEDIKMLESKAAALAEFARVNKVGLDEQMEWGIFRTEIEQRKGEFLDRYFPHGGTGANQYLVKSKITNLADIGITPDESANARLLNKTPLEEIRKIAENIAKSGKAPDPKSIAKEKRKIKKAEDIKIEQSFRNKQIETIEIRKGDFKEVLNDVYNIDAIITDPPYPAEYLQCFSELSKYASEHLKDNGWLIVYSGQYNLPEVIKRLSEYMTYVWTFCLYHEGKKQLVNGVNIMCGWKPVLIFSKGNKKMRFTAYDVVISKAMEKHSHEWQQSESGVLGLIEIFSKPGELIVDPFSGSGTFCNVAINNGRKSIGAEIV